MAYRAEIEIGVRGSSRLKELQDRITRLSRNIDDVNVKTLINRDAVQSVESYTQALSKAATNLREVTVQLDAAGRASGDYADAISQYVTALGQSNAAQKLQNDLIADEIELRRKQKLAASGIRESTQYGGPIGPGPASPVGMLAGQTSPVEERISRTLQGKKEQLELDQALLELERKSAEELNNKVRLQNDLVKGTQEVYELIAQTNREAATGIRPSTQYAGPIGPGPASPVDALVGQSSPVGERIARIRAYEAAAIDAANSVSKLAQEQEQAITQKELQNDAKVFREKLNKLVELGEIELEINKRNNDQALKDFNTRLANRTAGRFRTDGPLESPGFKSTQKSIGRMGESLALGAGFPLLFGGGAGSVAGSILGSFVGSGFGGQILGGALGQTLDQALVRIRDIGNAIQGLNFDALVESGIRLSGNLREQLDLLIRIGDADKARQLVSQEVATQTGTIAGTVEDVGNSVNILGDSWNKVTVTAGALLGMLSAPFAVALAGILEAVNAILYVVNSMFAVFAKGLKTIGEFVVNLIGGEGAAERVTKAINELNKELTDANVKAASLRNNLNVDNVRSLIELQTAGKLTPGVTTEDKITNIKIEAEKDLNLLYQDQLSAVSKIREENKNASKEVVDYLITQTEANYNNKRALVELNKERKIAAELERQAANAAKKAAQERKKQLDEEKAAYSRQLSLVGQAFTVTKQVADYDVQRTRIVEGETAALKTQLEQIKGREFIEKQLLDLQLEKALNTDKITAKERKLLQGIYANQLQLLKDTSALNAYEIKQKLALLDLEKKLAEQAAIRNAVAPFKELQRNRELEQQYAKTYLRLVTEGMLPAEAERIANFEKLVSEQLYAIDQQIILTEAAITEAEARGVSADKIKELRENLEALNKARGAVTDEATKGPGAGPTNRQRLEDAIAGVKGELNELVDPVNQIIGAAQAIGDAFSNSFKGIISGAMTAQEALASFFQNIADYFLDMAAQIIAKWIQMTILNSVLSLFPGGGGAGTSSNGMFGAGAPTETFAGGGIFSGAGPYQFPKKAAGGSVSSGKPYIVGELGPELFVPGKSGTIVPNNKLGGGDSNIVVNVDAGGSSVQGDDSQANQLGKVIGAAVQAELIKQKKPGGLLA